MAPPSIVGAVVGGLFGHLVPETLLLSGIGFIVLAIGGTLRNPEPAFQLRLHRKKTVAAGTA